MSRFVGSLDQGTTSTRFLVFDNNLNLICGHQVEHKQITPHPGWLEHDAEQIANNAKLCIEKAIEKLRRQVDGAHVECIGITNQRETTVAWSKSTGAPLTNAIVWSDARTAAVVNEIVAANGGKPTFTVPECGLPCSTYFSAMKMRWMLQNVPAVKAAESRGDLLFGTIDSWLIYNLSGREQFVTDVSNASRTMLMNIKTLQWDEKLCGIFGVRSSSLPRIVSNSEVIANVKSGVLQGVPISGCIGDQQAALFGQMCFEPGMAKNTYGTGCFLLANVGEQVRFSNNGLLSTVGFKLGSGKCIYALEGAIANAGATVQWMRDKMGYFQSWKESEELARSVPNTGGVVFVPAFSGLLAPHWRPDARGTIVGMSLQTTKAHIVRAALEAIAHQVVDVLRAMEKDSGIKFESLGVDGGLVNNKLLMETQSDLLGLTLNVPKMLETTALGAALCAGLAAGVWSGTDAIAAAARDSAAVKHVQPSIDASERADREARFKEGLSRSLGWAAKL